MTDLNSLVPANSPLHLMLACAINSSGQIVGFAVTSSGEGHEFLLSPSSLSSASGNPPSGEGRPRYPPGARRIVVEFAGGDLDTLAAAQPVKAEVSADNGHVESLTVQRTEGGSWRASIIVTPRAKKAVDLHCFLTLYGEVLTETWVYQWTP